MKPRLLLRIALVCILLVIAGSLMPSKAKQAIGTTGHTHLAHRVYHVLAFGATALLLLLAVSTRTQAAAVAIATALLGLALEYIQHWVHGGAVEWWDIRDDCIGVALAYVLVRLARSASLA